MLPVGARKLLSQALPEPAPEPVQGTAIVVIHPGSYNLRLGRASDAFPHTLPHCIARRLKHPKYKKSSQDEWLARPEFQHGNAQDMENEGLQMAQSVVKCRPTSMGTYRRTTSISQLNAINRHIIPETSDVLSPLQWTNTKLKHEYLIGEEALYTHPDDCYSLFWPIRRGRLNVHNAPGGTLSAVAQDLETIWSYSIQNYLDIPFKDLKHYRAVLLIADTYCRKHIKEMMTILLDRLGFGAAFAVQETICATFGSGLSSACVVDIGDQKTSVCCVEDGCSQKRTRIYMGIGGSDITRCYYRLLKKSGFPYTYCDLGNRMDALFLQNLKENYCHLDQDLDGTENHLLQVKHPSNRILKVMVQMGDERLLAPMSVFYPDMFGLQGSDLIQIQEKYVSDPDDPHDEDYIIQTMSKHEQAARLVAARKKESAEAANQNPDTASVDDCQMDDDDLLDQSESMNADNASSGNKPLKKPWEEGEEVVDISQGLLGIHQAILQSIDKCENDEIRKRMYSSILVVGGGLMFPESDSWLQYLVWTQMPPQHRITLESMEVITRPKELDPRLTSWKGGAMLCCLDTAQELWIRQREWKRFGVKVLRERAPFLW